MTAMRENHYVVSPLRVFFRYVILRAQTQIPNCITVRYTLWDQYITKVNLLGSIVIERVCPAAYIYSWWIYLLSRGRKLAVTRLHHDAKYSRDPNVSDGLYKNLDHLYFAWDAAERYAFAQSMLPLRIHFCVQRVIKTQTFTFKTLTNSFLSFWRVSRRHFLCVYNKITLMRLFCLTTAHAVPPLCTWTRASRPDQKLMLDAACVSY